MLLTCFVSKRCHHHDEHVMMTKSMSWFLMTHFFQNWSKLIKINKTDQNEIMTSEAPCSGVPQNGPLLDRFCSVLIKLMGNHSDLIILLKLNCSEPFWNHPKTVILVKSGVTPFLTTFWSKKGYPLFERLAYNSRDKGVKTGSRMTSKRGYGNT